MTVLFMRELKEMNELILIIINKVIFVASVVLLMENNTNTLCFMVC